jgi:choline dehydrogenase-like flavoprotein
LFFLRTAEQPYVTPEGRPFALTRVWGHGGKTNVWGRVSLRYAEMDLKAADRDGWEIPWPIAYADIAPYYDQVEQLIGVCGGTDDSEALPGSRFLQPPPAPRCGERLLPAAAAAEQTALLTRLSKEGNSDGEDRIGIEFFEAIKSMTINGYYTTQIGLRQELGDDGQLFLAQFPGCTHPEHQG